MIGLIDLLGLCRPSFRLLGGVGRVAVSKHGQARLLYPRANEALRNAISEQTRRWHQSGGQHWSDLNRDTWVNRKKSCGRLCPPSRDTGATVNLKTNGFRRRLPSKAGTAAAGARIQVHHAVTQFMLPPVVVFPECGRARAAGPCGSRRPQNGMWRRRSLHPAVGLLSLSAQSPTDLDEAQASSSRCGPSCCITSAGSSLKKTSTASSLNEEVAAMSMCVLACCQHLGLVYPLF